MHREIKVVLRSCCQHYFIVLYSLAQGKASALLPIYHYAFTTYSCEIAELIASTDTELYTKTDLRFIEGCYKVQSTFLYLLHASHFDNFTSPNNDIYYLLLLVKTVGLINFGNFVRATVFTVHGVYQF